MKDKQEKMFYGGQAVIEGVMMRGKTMYAMAVRNTKKEIVIDEVFFENKKPAFFKWILIRGCVSFIESMIVGMKIITKSAEMAGLDDLEGEEPSKFETYLTEKFGNEKINNFIIGFSVVVAMILSISLFILFPTWIGGFFRELLGENIWLLSVIEGLLRISIFLVYIFFISKMKDIQRVFQYHGAEHKTINCYESKDELTVENVKKHSRLHKRCGTSFLLIVMVVSMVTYMFLRVETVLLRTLSRLALLPFIAGVSYEVVKWAGRSDSAFVRIISAPGMALQKWTTREPDEEQIEVAITALKKVLEYEQNAENEEDEIINKEKDE